jgi:hypothetical protein
MKTLFIYVVAVLLTLSLNAQTRFGARGGVSFSSHDGSNSNSTDLVTIQASGFMMMPLGTSVVFQPSLGYHPIGNKYKNLGFSDPLGNNVGYGDLTTRYDNIEMTAPFQYALMKDKDRKLLLGLGPFFRYAFGGMAKWKNVSGQTEPPAKAKLNFGTGGEKRFDAGVDLLLTYQPDKHWTLNVHYDRGLVQVHPKTSPNQIFYTNSQGITVGYLFK